MLRRTITLIVVNLSVLFMVVLMVNVAGSQVGLWEVKHEFCDITI